MKPAKTLAIAALLTTSLTLGGCISLFPKSKPSQLYTFKAAVAEAASAPKPTVVVLRAPTVFTRASASDRILTRNGSETAYIAEARWAAPASVLFDEALAAAFDNSAVRLATRGEPGPTAALLRVEVRTFEAQYRNGADKAPTAVVEVRATLNSLRDRDMIDSRMFRAEHPATDNRAGPIVDAYDAAVGDVLDQVVRWTTDTVKPANAP